MNASSSENSRQDGDQAAVESLRAKLQHLREVVTSRRQKAETKCRVHIVLGICLCIACIIGFSTLTSQAFRLDAEALTQIGRHEVERNLPSGREAMSEYLQSKAPDVVSRLVEAIQSALPQLRPLIVKELEQNLQGVVGEFERQLITLTEASVKATKADLDAKFPDKSDTEKVRLLMSAVAQQFNSNVEQLLKDMYPECSAEFQRVEEYLTGLKSKPAQQLTSRDRLEKEMLETLLRLIVREQQNVPPLAR